MTGFRMYQKIGLVKWSNFFNASAKQIDLGSLGWFVIESLITLFSHFIRRFNPNLVQLLYLTLPKH